MGIISTNKMFKSFALCALAGVAAASFRHGFDLGSSYGSSQPYGGYGIGHSYGGHNIHGTKSAAGRRSAGSFGRGATVRAHSGQGGQAGLSGGYGRFGGQNIHGTIAPAGRRSVGSFGQGATVRGHSGEQSFSKGVYGSPYSKQVVDINDERVSRFNDGKAARGGYTESINYGYGKRTGGKHQTGNLNSLNLGRQSRGYGDNYAHVGATENDYLYGVQSGYGYDGYGHADIHDWGAKSGWGADGWGSSKAWGRKGDKNGLSGLKGLRGFDGIGSKGIFGRKGGLSFRTLYDAGPDEYRGNEGDYIQGRHDVDDPSRFSHHYDGDRDSGEKDDRVVDDVFDPEDAELQYPQPWQQIHHQPRQRNQSRQIPR